MSFRNFSNLGQECIRPTEMSDTEKLVENLRHVDATELQLLNVGLAYNNQSNFPIWAPIKHDGVFFISEKSSKRSLKIKREKSILTYKFSNSQF